MPTDLLVRRSPGWLAPCHLLQPFNLPCRRPSSNPQCGLNCGGLGPSHPFERAPNGEGFVAENRNLLKLSSIETRKHKERHRHKDTNTQIQKHTHTQREPSHLLTQMFAFGLSGAKTWVCLVLDLDPPKWWISSWKKGLPTPRKRHSTDEKSPESSPPPVCRAEDMSWRFLVRNLGSEHGTARYPTSGNI